jgi:photosystem II stability/assembly factor-like uncharacterized protein
VSGRQLGFAVAAACVLAAAATTAPAPQEPAPSARAAVTSLTVFAGTTSGLFRSYDWGNTWHPAASAGKANGLDAVGAVRDVLPVGPSVYLAGDGGVYQSGDFGETWTRTETPTPVARVLPSRYPQSDPTVFAATPTGLLKSSDGGRTFAATVLSGMRVHRLEWPGPALVAATERGVVISMDGGATFTSPQSGLPPGDARALALSSFFTVDPVLFAGVGSRGVYRSGDGGRTWTAAGLAGESVTDLAWLGPFLYAVTANGLFRTEDMGRAWTQLKQGLKSAPTRVLFPLMPASGTEVFLGTVGGMYHSGDGGTNWTKSGLDGETVLCVATFPPMDNNTSRGRKPKR